MKLHKKIKMISKKMILLLGFSFLMTGCLAPTLPGGLAGKTSGGGSLTFKSGNNSVDIVSPLAYTTFTGPLVISGICLSNIDVTIGFQNEQLATVPCLESQFQVEITVPGNDGQKLIMAKQIDPNNNSEIGNDSRMFIKNSVTADNVVITSPVANFATQGSLTLSGTCSLGLSLEVFVSGVATPLGSDFCNVQGLFNIPIQIPGADGLKLITVNQVTGAGAVVNFDSRRFVKDTEAPELTITSPAPGEEALAGLDITGTCEAGTTLSYAGTGNQNSFSEPCPANGIWTFTMLFTEGIGSKEFIVRSTDSADNSTSVTRLFTRTNSGQNFNLSFSAPANNSAFNNSFTITGLCAANEVVNLTGGAGEHSFPCSANNTFSRNVTLLGSDGVKTLLISQRFGTNNLSDTRNFIKDTVAPTLNINSPNENSQTFGTLVVTGTCEAGASEVRIQSTHLANTVNTPCNGSFNKVLNISGAEGPFNVTFIQSDNAANTTTKSRSFVLAIPSGGEQRFLDALTVLSTRCFICHSDGNGQFNFLTEEQYVLSGYVVPEDIEGSKITKRTKFHNGVTNAPENGANMPDDPAAYASFTLEEYNKLKDWVLGMQPPPGINNNISKYQVPNIATRKYIKDVFVKVFSSQLNGVYEYNIYKRSAEFAGPCDRYASSKARLSYNNYPAVSSKDACKNGDQDVRLAVIGNANVLRAGWLINTCEMAVEDSASLEFALNQIFNGQTITNPTNATIQKAWQLFYPGEAASNGMIQKLQEVSNMAPSSNYQNWKNVLVTICMTPDWQVP